MIYLVFIVNLLVTLLVEGLLVLLFFRRRDFVYYSGLANMLTNPLLNLLLLLAVNWFGAASYLVFLVFLELAVILIEGLIWQRLGAFRWLKALALAAFLNLASFTAGRMLDGIW